MISYGTKIGENVFLVDENWEIKQKR